MSLSPQAQFIIGPQDLIADNYFDQIFLAKARQHGEACPSAPPADPDAVSIQGTTFNNHFYYDLPLSLYIAYSRTNDPSFLLLARKAADVWWQHPQWIGSGRIRQFPDSATPAPRHAGIGGLILRALDGRPEMWDWINACTRASFDIWIKLRIGNPQLHYGLREGGFALQFAAWLVKTLPDTFPLQSGGTATNGAALRAQYLADIESACVNYFGRLQQPDGSWRWNTTPDEPRDEDGGTWVGIMQPFMVGLMTSALCDAHQVVTSDIIKENIKTQILKACRHLFIDGPYARITATNFAVQTRGFHYFYHGGTSVNATKYANGDIPKPWTTSERWHIESARQAISTVLPAFGYAYKISGDEFFRTAGDELWDAAYSGSDGFRAMLADTAKNFNQHARRVGSYRAWRDGLVAERPKLPPSPDGTKASTIVDSQGATWTLGPERQTLRDGVQVGKGAGTTYKYLTSLVNVLGINDRWYKWTGTDWSDIGTQEPGTRTVSYPKQPSKRNQILEAQWRERYRLKSESDATAVFEKVL